MLTSKKFAASLANIRKNDEAFRVLIAETLAFAIFHARNHGQKTPFMQLQEAVPGWLQKPIKSVPLGKVSAKNALSEENAEHEAAFRVAEWFASHDEQKAIRAANRKAKPAPAPKVETVEPMPSEMMDTSDPIDGESQVVDVESAIIFDGKAVQVTSEEAELLVAYLTQLRTPALKVA